MKDLEIRTEQPGDHPAIDHLLRAAFPTDAEARLVTRLRATVSPFLSLVAIERANHQLIGQLLLTPVTVTNSGSAQLLGLAPMAVLPEWQNLGVGSALVRAGTILATQRDFAGIVLVGHSGFYPRFGFRPASGFGLRCEYDVPDAAFMALPLRPDGLAGCGGLVRYAEAFAEL